MIFPGSRHRSKDIAVMSALFLATAAVVVWQNARLTVLWDFSFIVDTATRIAFGDVPYRDFPFPYAPVTFLVQAAIIRLFGRAAWHHAAYAAVMGGAASALTYAIVRQIESRRIVAIALAAPLTILGIYCIFPHPFYDPDCCVVILVVILLLIRNVPMAAGATAVLAVFVKQNIGLALVIAVVGLALITRQWRVILGVVVAAVASIAIVATAFGIDNYIRWTIRYAAQRRLMPIAEYLSIYVDPTLCWWIACCVIGAFVLRRSRIAGVALISAPFFWSIVRIFLTDDPLEREINLLRAWPLVIVCAAIAALRERDVVPLIVIAAVHGAFLSQITWGSTYGIWPLLVILLAFTLRRMPALVAFIVVAAILAGGVPYVIKNERLTYVKLDGERHRAYGLTVNGEWLPDFEQLVAWLDRNVPRDDAILFLPGEDPLYFVTGRRPQFPVLMFDRTINPYDAATIARLADERHVRWVIIKKRLQLNGTPMEGIDEVVRRVTAGARIVSLRNYIVAERSLPVSSPKF
jgi:hypothetical protein